MKRLLCLTILPALLLCGCGGNTAPGEIWIMRRLVLRYYTIGRADRDLSQVNNALNKLLYRRYGFQVGYRRIDWNEYENKISGLLNTLIFWIPFSLWNFF